MYLPYEPMLTKQECAQYFGGIRPMCRALGISWQAYYKWDTYPSHKSWKKIRELILDMPDSTALD